MVLQTLIKIGLETIAANEAKTVFEDRFNPARKYALNGIKNYPWFYIQKEDNKMLNRYIKGILWDDYHCYMEVHYEDDGLVFLHLRVFYLEFLVPLVENVILDKNNKFEEPDQRVITV